MQHRVRSAAHLLLLVMQPEQNVLGQCGLQFWRAIHLCFIHQTLLHLL